MEAVDGGRPMRERKDLADDIFVHEDLDALGDNVDCLLVVMDD